MGLLALPPGMPLMFEFIGLLALPDILALPLLMLPFVVVPVVLVVLVVPVVVVVVVLETFVFVPVVLPLVLSVVVQPAQKTATASRAKRARVLRIEFSPVTQWVNVLGAMRALSSRYIKGFRINSVKVRATRANTLQLPTSRQPKSERGHVKCSQSLMLGV
jgi:hypothetical protein